MALYATCDRPCRRHQLHRLQRSLHADHLPLRTLHHVAIADAVAYIRALKHRSFALLLQVVVRQPAALHHKTSTNQQQTNAAATFGRRRNLHGKKHAAAADCSFVSIE